MERSTNGLHVFAACRDNNVGKKPVTFDEK